MKRGILLQLLCLLGASSALLAQGGGHMGHAIDKNLIFPHFVVGGGVQTQIILMNPRPGIDLTGTLFFFQQDGTALQVSSDGGNVNQLSVTIPAEGIEFVNVTSSEEDPVVGWALLEVSGPGQGQDDPRTRVFGSVTFTTTEGTQTTGTVGVVAGRFELGANRTIAVPVIVTEGTSNTGVALVNAGTDPMTLTFQLKDEDGTVVQEGATIDPPISPLAPGNQRALFATELFDGFDFGEEFTGTLAITTEQEGLVAIGLLTNGPLLTSIPVAQIPGQGQGGPNAQTHTVTDQGFTFSPAELTIAAGDTVQWQLANIHNVVEVTEATWNANGTTPKPEGFSTQLGGGSVTFDTPGTYFYVCSPHAFQGMKGKVIVNAAL